MSRSDSAAHRPGSAGGGRRPLLLAAGALLAGLLAGPCAAPRPERHRLAAAARPAVAAPEKGEAFLAARARASYVVRANDTLGAIAGRAGVRLDALLEANPELAEDPRQVAIGERVEIPLGPRRGTGGG